MIFMTKKKGNEKLLALLDIVIDTYINKWEPVGSKFLNSLEWIEDAPSTLRKHLNQLEKQWVVYQPYNSSGRIPTVNWLKLYIENYLQQMENMQSLEIDSARLNMKEMVEMLWSLVDWVIIWFLRNDEYYYLWVNNLLKESDKDNLDETKSIISFIEEKRIVRHIDWKILKKNQIYYTFMEDGETTISAVYAKVILEWYDCILAIVWPLRVNYKRNVAILSQVLQKLDQ